MKISKKLPFNFHFFLFIRRKRLAYGVRSNRPNNDRYHNLFYDIDTNLSRDAIAEYDWVERTPHGFHAVKLGNYSYKRALEEISKDSTVDRSWLSMGVKRGYWFLELFHLPPSTILRHLTPMKIERF